MTVRTMEHRHLRRRVALERDEGLVQRGGRVTVNGIAHVGAAQRHHGDSVKLLHVNGGRGVCEWGHDLH